MYATVILYTQRAGSLLDKLACRIFLKHSNACIDPNQWNVTKCCTVDDNK